MNQSLRRRINNFSRCVIVRKTTVKLHPKILMHMCMRKKGQTHFEYVEMLSLCCTTLLVCMWTRHMM